MAFKTPLGVDRMIELDVSGSTQRLRISAARTELAPLLVVQGGPALPILHEVAKFRRRLNLEQRFLVGYWEQRGCGNAPRRYAEGVSWPQQIDDLRTVLRWFHGETRQRVIVLGISIGATMALEALGADRDRVKAVIAVSPDSNTAESDAAADSFLRNHARNGAHRRFERRIAKLARPPYLDPATFQKRTRLLVDLGTIETGKIFRTLLFETLVGMVRAYGVAGAAKAMRNMNLVQRRLLPQIVSLDLFTNPPRVTVPVHYVFGARDAVTAPSVPDRLPAVIGAPSGTMVRLADAGHMAHFDRPDVVRSIAESA